LIASIIDEELDIVEKPIGDRKIEINRQISLIRFMNYYNQLK